MIRQPLHLKYRPLKLQDIVGQDIIVTRLTGMLKTQQIPSSILFTGGTGLGKTTSMRILARTLNCDSLSGCGECKNCIAFDKEAHPDYAELNVGEHKGIDDMRALLQKARMLPQIGNLRILALDEVQNLTSQSQQLLLKPLEEPPAHTLWLLGSMEPEKLNPALVNRCQVFQLKTIPKSDLHSYLKKILKKEKKELDDSILEFIVALSGGSTRQCIQALDAGLQYVDGLENRPKNLDKLLRSVLLESISISDDDTLVPRLLKAVLVGQPKTLHLTILDIQNPVSFLNKFINTLIFCSASKVGIDKHEKLYANIVNKEALTILRGVQDHWKEKYEEDNKVYSNFLASVLAELMSLSFELRLQLHQVPGVPEYVYCLSRFLTFMLKLKETTSAWKIKPS